MAALAADAESRQGSARSAAGPDKADVTRQSPLAGIAKVLLGLELDYSDTALRLGCHLAALRWHASVERQLRPAGARVSGTLHNVSLPHAGPASACSRDLGVQDRGR